MTTDQRLAMLQTQLTWLKSTLETAEKFETENPDADIDCVCAAIEDSISSVEFDILDIDGWAEREVESEKANRADHDRDERLMGEN